MKERLSIWLERRYDSSLKLEPFPQELIDLAEDIKTTNENSHGWEAHSRVVTVINRIRITAKTLADNGININSLPRSGKTSFSINGKKYSVCIFSIVELHPGYVHDGKGSLEWSPTSKWIRWFFPTAFGSLFVFGLPLQLGFSLPPFAVGVVLYGLIFYLVSKFINPPPPNELK